MASEDSAVAPSRPHNQALRERLQASAVELAAAWQHHIPLQVLLPGAKPVSAAGHSERLCGLGVRGRPSITLLWGYVPCRGPAPIGRMTIQLPSAG